MASRRRLGALALVSAIQVVAPLTAVAEALAIAMAVLGLRRD